MHQPEIVVPQVLKEMKMVRCALTTRHGGVSPSPLGMNMSYSVGDDPANVDENRRRFFELLEIPGELLAIPRQCHSSTVRVARTPGTFDATDGLVTDRKNLWLVLSVADCTPVFVYDPKHGAVGAFHAGWRGSADRIVERGVRLMMEEFGSHPSDLLTYVGPAAGPCCYEVGSEVADRFTNGVVSERNGSIYLDLKKENVRQLIASGIPEERIEQSNDCTICGGERYHSYRRDQKRSGRMMGIIGVRG